MIHFSQNKHAADSIFKPKYVAALSSAFSTWFSTAALIHSLDSLRREIPWIEATPNNV